MQQQPLIRFRGAPPGLEAFGPGSLAAEGEGGGGVTLKLPGRASHLAELEAVEVDAGASHLRLSLPPATPPGSYEGTARVGERDYRIVVEVEPAPALRFAPGVLVVDAAAGGDAEAHVSVLNAGNVPLELGRAYAFGLFADDGIEEAFGAAFRAPEPKGERRFDVFVEELTDKHGGLARVRVVEGAGTLEPGQVGVLRLAFTFPKELEAGRTYAGTWPLHGSGYTVRVRVSEPKIEVRRRRKAQ